jgi:hypothetical protein
MRTSFVRYVSPTPHHTSFRKERAIVGAARGRSASAIPDLELIHPGVSDLNRETPFGNSTRILSVVVAHLHCAASSTRGSPVTETRFYEFAWRPRHLAPALLGAQLRCLALGVERRAPRQVRGGLAATPIARCICRAALAARPASTLRRIAMREKRARVTLRRAPVLVVVPSDSHCAELRRDADLD